MAQSQRIAASGAADSSAHGAAPRLIAHDPKDAKPARSDDKISSAKFLEKQIAWPQLRTRVNPDAKLVSFVVASYCNLGIDPPLCRLPLKAICKGEPIRTATNSAKRSVGYVLQL